MKIQKSVVVTVFCVILLASNHFGAAAGNGSPRRSTRKRKAHNFYKPSKKRSKTQITSIKRKKHSSNVQVKNEAFLYNIPNIPEKIKPWSKYKLFKQNDIATANKCQSKLKRKKACALLEKAHHLVNKSNVTASNIITAAAYVDDFLRTNNGNINLQQKVWNVAEIIKMLIYNLKGEEKELTQKIVTIYFRNHPLLPRYTPYPTTVINNRYDFHESAPEKRQKRAYRKRHATVPKSSTFPPTQSSTNSQLKAFSCRLVTAHNNAMDTDPQIPRITTEKSPFSQLEQYNNFSITHMPSLENYLPTLNDTNDDNNLSWDSLVEAI